MSFGGVLWIQQQTLIQIGYYFDSWDGKWKPQPTVRQPDHVIYALDSTIPQLTRPGHVPRSPEPQLTRPDTVVVWVPDGWGGWDWAKWKEGQEVPNLPTSPGGNWKTKPSAPKDPNSLVGPSGYGLMNLVQTSGLLAYRINFENDATATAPAHEVVISNPLSASLDWSTFSLTEIAFGDHFIAVPSGTQHYTKVESMTYNGVSFEVHIEAGIHLATGEVYARFTSLDPLTGLPPAVDVGFLPPEDGTGRGQGHVSYVIKPMAGLANGTEIRNIAWIVFDGQPAISTNQVDPHDPSQGTDPTKEAPITIWTGPLPIVATGAATGITSASATLNGTISPNGYETTAQFEYGLTTEYGMTAGGTPSPVSGSTTHNVGAGISGLQQLKNYHYRLTGTNSLGKWFGEDATFTTIAFVPTITATAGAHGTITPSGAVSVTYGLDQEFTISPAVHCHVTDVLVDGVSVGAVLTYKFTKVTSNHTISASFAIDTHTITASADENGTIEPSGLVQVNHGSDQTFRINPAEGYRVADVRVDGSSVGRASSYTIKNVTSDRTISATFERQQAAVPTFSQYGYLIFVVLVAASAVFFIRRMRRAI
jgi:hypothetical protein